MPKKILNSESEGDPECNSGRAQRAGGLSEIGQFRTKPPTSPISGSEAHSTTTKRVLNNLLLSHDNLGLHPSSSDNRMNRSKFSQKISRRVLAPVEMTLAWTVRSKKHDLADRQQETGNRKLSEQQINSLQGSQPTHFVGEVPCVLPPGDKASHVAVNGSPFNT